jgi:hypothetical protein
MSATFECMNLNVVTLFAPDRIHHLLSSCLESQYCYLLKTKILYSECLQANWNFGSIEMQSLPAFLFYAPHGTLAA